VALWSRQPAPSNFSADLGAARFDGAWETKQVYDLATRFVDYDAAVNSAGQILLAGQLDHGTNASLQEIFAATVPSLAAPWPDVTLVSPASNGTNQLYRGPVAAAGGTDFFLGWSVHGGARHGQVVATSTPPACAAAAAAPTSTPTPSPTAAPAPSPQPLPLAKQTPKTPPKAIGGFVTLSTPKRCSGRITVKIKRPRDFPIRRIVVRVNGKRRTTLTGRGLKRPLTLTRVPKGAFTLSFEIGLKNGRTVKGKQHFGACR
jgi:hypothetical protein